MFEEPLSWLPLIVGAFVVFSIFSKASDPKALFGTDVQKLGSVSYRKSGITTTLNVYNLAKRDRDGHKLIGLEIRRVGFAGFRVQHVELPHEQAQQLMDAFQKGVG
jgi:hypothetical protein